MSWQKWLNEVFVIGEAGLNHNGQYHLAVNQVNAAIASGANAVKFQRRTVRELATESELSRIDPRFPSLGKTYGDIRTANELSLDELKNLKLLAHEGGLKFSITPFDILALHEVVEIGVDFLKIASHSVTNIPLLKEAAKFDLPTVMSTGMATVFEIDSAVQVFREKCADLALLHCVSSYPTPSDEVNLKMIEWLAKRYDVPVGYSGHELGWLATGGAVVCGAQIIERHYTEDKKFDGFDHEMSLDFDELRRMVSDIRELESMLSFSPKQVTPKEQMTRSKYHVSMAARYDLDVGHVLRMEDVYFTNPGTGISYSDHYKFLGKKLKRKCKARELMDGSCFS